MKLYQLYGLPKLPAVISDEMQVSLPLTGIQYNRDSIIASWLSDTGLNPSEAVLCMQKCPDGSIRVLAETNEKHERRMARFPVAEEGDGE